MKKVVVDTNVIFSAILNTNSQIGDLILNSDQYFKFYTAFYLRQEFEKHQGKLLEISKLSEAELEESKHQIFKKINFLSEEQIHFEVWHRSVQYVRDVDMDDIAFWKSHLSNRFRNFRTRLFYMYNWRVVQLHRL